MSAPQASRLAVIQAFGFVTSSATARSGVMGKHREENQCLDRDAVPAIQETAKVLNSASRGKNKIARSTFIKHKHRNVPSTSYYKSTLHTFKETSYKYRYEMSLAARVPHSAKILPTS